MHAVLAKQGVAVRVSDLFGVAGRALLETLPLDPVYRGRVNSLLRLIDAFDFEIGAVSSRLTAQLAREPGYQALLALPGVGPVLAGVFFAEIGDVHRFSSAAHLVSWAGLTPRHRESDTTVHRGSITKQGSTLVRWAAIEACQRTQLGTKLAADRARIIATRGRNIGVVAAARRLLTLVYYGLRDGHIRALAREAG